MDQAATKEQIHRRSASQSPPQQAEPGSGPSSTRQNLHKRGHFDISTPTNVDTMD